MGLYDQFVLPSNGQYISTYAGQAIQETAALGEVIGKRYDKGMEGISAYNVMRNNAEVLSADENMKNDIFDESYKGLKEYAERGDYENALPAIMNATTMVSGDKKLREAMAAKQSAAKFSEDVEKMYQAGKIEDWQRDLALSKMGNYKGVASGDSIGAYTRTPAHKVDIRANMEDAAKAVRQETRLGPLEWNDELGKYEQYTTKTYDRNELDAAMGSVLNDPATLAYYTEMTEAYGAEAADAMIQQYRGAIKEGMNNQTPGVQYVSPAKGYGPNSPGGKNLIGGGQTKDAETLPQQKKEGIDFITTGQDLDVRNFGEGSPLIGYTPGTGGTMEEKIAEVDAMKKSMEGQSGVGGKLKSLWNSVVSTAQGLPDDEEIKEYRKVEDAAQSLSGKTDEQWAQMTPEERETQVYDYIQTGGKRQSRLLMNGFDLEEEADNRNIKGSDVTSTVIADRITDDVKLNRGSRKFYNLTVQEAVKYGDDDDLTKALQGEDDYTFEVIKEADPRNPYSEDNPALANSYVARVVNKKGKEEYYLVSKDKAYMNATNREMEARGFDVNNEQYATKVAELTNMFPTVEYENSYSDGNGVSFDGKRSKYNDDAIALTNLNTKDGQIDVATIAPYLQAKGYEVGIDPKTGELLVANEHVLSQLIFELGLTDTSKY